MNTQYNKKYHGLAEAHSAESYPRAKSVKQHPFFVSPTCSMLSATGGQSTQTHEPMQEVKNILRSMRSIIDETQVVDMLVATLNNNRATGKTPYSAQQFNAAIEAGTLLVILDGLDEVLVHLDGEQGNSFLRKLWRIFPDNQPCQWLAFARLQ